VHLHSHIMSLLSGSFGLWLGFATSLTYSHLQNLVQFEANEQRPLFAHETNCVVQEPLHRSSLHSYGTGGGGGIWAKVIWLITSIAMQLIVAT
jgi:hypothetical protein